MMITNVRARAALVALVPLALLGLTACGDDGGSASDAGSDTTGLEVACDDLEVTGAFVRLPPGDNTAIYAELSNTGDVDTALVGADAAIADTAIADEFELHEVVDVDGVMEMAPIEGQRIELPAGESVVLEPGGLHVMALGVTVDLAIGDEVDVELAFDGGCTVPVTAEVRAVDEGGMGPMPPEELPDMTGEMGG